MNQNNNWPVGPPGFRDPYFFPPGYHDDGYPPPHSFVPIDYHPPSALSSPPRIPRPRPIYSPLRYGPGYDPYLYPYFRFPSREQGDYGGSRNSSQLLDLSRSYNRPLHYTAGPPTQIHPRFVRSPQGSLDSVSVGSGAQSSAFHQPPTLGHYWKQRMPMEEFAAWPYGVPTPEVSPDEANYAVQALRIPPNFEVPIGKGRGGRQKGSPPPRPMGKNTRSGAARPESPTTMIQMNTTEPKETPEERDSIQVTRPTRAAASKAAAQISDFFLQSPDNHFHTLRVTNIKHVAKEEDETATPKDDVMWQMPVKNKRSAPARSNAPVRRKRRNKSKRGKSVGKPHCGSKSPATIKDVDGGRDLLTYDDDQTERNEGEETQEGFIRAKQPEQILSTDNEQKTPSSSPPWKKLRYGYTKTSQERVIPLGNTLIHATPKKLSYETLSISPYVSLKRIDKHILSIPECAKSSTGSDMDISPSGSSPAKAKERDGTNTTNNPDCEKAEAEDKPLNSLTMKLFDDTSSGGNDTGLDREEILPELVRLGKDLFEQGEDSDRSVTPCVDWSDDDENLFDGKTNDLNVSRSYPSEYPPEDTLDFDEDSDGMNQVSLIQAVVLPVPCIGPEDNAAAGKEPDVTKNIQTLKAIEKSKRRIVFPDMPVLE